MTSLILSLGDAFIKRLSADLVLWQIFILRSVIALPVLMFFLWSKGRLSSLVPQSFAWTTIRSLMLALMWVSYYASLPHIQLGIAAAAYYTLPIFITLFASLLLGDRISPFGWVAVFVGFAGVVLILNPQAGDVNFYVFLPIISAILFALAMIITRSKCRSDDAFALSIHLNVMFIVIGAIGSCWGLLNPDLAQGGDAFIWGAWPSMTSFDWVVMTLLAAAIVIGSVGSAIAFQLAPPATLAPFNFAYVAFAVLWGFLLFSETPTSSAVIGMLLVVVAGVGATRPSSKSD